MKYILIACSVFISACTSLTNFQEQPVLELGKDTYKTTCNGIAEGWDSCFRKAQKTCGNGYSVIDKTQLNDFVHREITYKCS
jgi:hypothetical protein